MYWASFICSTLRSMSRAATGGGGPARLPRPGAHTSLLRGRLDVDEDLLEGAPPGVRHSVRIVRLREVRPVRAVRGNGGRNIHHVDVFHVLNHLLDDLAAGVGEVVRRLVERRSSSDEIEHFLIRDPRRVA